MSIEINIQILEQENGMRGFQVDHCQPQMQTKRAYKKQPKQVVVWFSDTCGFGMPIENMLDEEVWVHEFTENTLASIIMEETGRNGLRYKISRWFKENGRCLSFAPTSAHFLTSLTEKSATFTPEEGIQWISGDEYFDKFLVGSQSHAPLGCVSLVKLRTFKIRVSGDVPVFNSLPRDMKDIIRARVCVLYGLGVRPGGYDTILSTPWGISERILYEYGIRIWGKTCQRIVNKYFFT